MATLRPTTWRFVAALAMAQKPAKQKKVLQELVDCRADKSERDGCRGGSTGGAYEVVEALGGMELESAYPYVHQNQACHFQASPSPIEI